MSARWYSEDPRTNAQVDYNAADSKSLEDSYQGRKQAVSLTLGGMRFTVDVKAMTQSNNSGGSRKVKRVQTAAATTSANTKLSVSSETTKFFNKCSGGESELQADQFTNIFGPLGVNAENADCFVFVYLLKCKGCWKITREEFEQGCAASGMNPTKSSVGSAVESAKKNFQRDPAEFVKFFGFVWGFVRNSPNATIVPTEEAIPFMELVMTVGPKTQYPMATVLEYYAAKVKAISSDLWKQTAKFCIETKKDLSNYDEMACWNTVIDDFVEEKKG